MNPEQLRKAWEAFTEKNDFMLNPDDMHVDIIIEGVLQNEARHGLKLCPCRLRYGDHQKDLELICPCNFKAQETWRTKGMCWCGLFVKKKEAKMDLKKALETALDFEQKGHALYEEASLRSQNPILSKTFRYLADQELIHIEEIKEYLARKDASQKAHLKGDNLEKTQKFFSSTVKEFKDKLSLSKDDVHAYQAALELEKLSYNFYEERGGEAQDPDVKDFFQWIVGQEKAHYALIENAYSFIKDPEGFYKDEEKWIVEG